MCIRDSTEDVYLVLDQVPDPDDEAIRLRVIIRPMVAWMWAGGVLMAFGTLLALFPGGRRRGTEPVSAPVKDAGSSSGSLPETIDLAAETVPTAPPTKV